VKLKREKGKVGEERGLRVPGRDGTGVQQRCRWMACLLHITSECVSDTSE
jgi:hypothetical protein